MTDYVTPITEANFESSQGAALLTLNAIHKWLYYLRPIRYARS